MSNLLERVPSFYHDDVSLSILSSLQNEEVLLSDTLQDVQNQFFVESATWGIEFWEKMLSISGVKLDLQARRENVKAKMRSRGASTLTTIKNICEAYSNGEVDIIVDHANYSFVVKFVGTMGIPKAIKELERTMDEIKPCHLKHTYEFTYMTFGEFDAYNKTWDAWDTLNLTWDQFEVYREV